MSDAIFGPLFVHHSETSREAAESIRPHVAGLKAKVRAFFVSRGSQGATDEELIDALGLSPSTARPRRIECVSAGWVRDSGTTRKTRSGRNATVWVMAEGRVP